MKKIQFSILALTLFISSCVCWVQVMDTETISKGIEKVPSQNHSYVYQNDSIAVIYTFWAKKGVLAFSIYNKLEVPIYIDWKKCSYISKGNKWDYWKDDKTVNGTSVTTGYIYKGNALFVPNVFGGTISTQTISSEERVTFIPPRSYYYRSDFLITPRNWYDTNKLVKTTIPSLANPGKTIEAKFIELTYDTSPFKFRNFLTWSTKENFEVENYLDHEFYVAKVTMVKDSEFTNDTYSNTSAIKYFYKRNDRFYVYPKITDH
ncbi:hypothetical protein BH09BAC1_BH09BAC1_15850 [soil metagenome]